MGSDTEIPLFTECDVTPDCILSMKDFEGIELLSVEKIRGNTLHSVEQTSFSSEYDENKIKYLISWGIMVPENWYTRSLEDLMPNAQFHAEIVTATIIMIHLKDIFTLIDERRKPQDMEKEISVQAQWWINERINRDGLRDPDVTGRYRNRETRKKMAGISCNERGQVSPVELRELVLMVINSFKENEWKSWAPFKG